MSTLYSVLHDSGSGRGMASSETSVYHTRAHSGEEAIKKVMKHEGYDELPASSEFEYLRGGGAFYFYDGGSWSAEEVEEI